MKTTLMWADGASVKREVDLRVMLLLGPKTEEDLLNAKIKPKKTPKEPPVQNSISNRVSKKSKDPADLAEPGDFHYGFFISVKSLKDVLRTSVVRVSSITR